jgi:putative transposase
LAFRSAGEADAERRLQNFNGRTRDEPLDESLLFRLDHARAKIAEWINDCNHRRSHSALSDRSQARYAANLLATCDRAHNPGELHRSHVAPPALNGAKSAEAPVAAG